MIWCCPLHHGELTPVDGGLRAACCATLFALVDGIPDLRVSRGSWLDIAADLDAARHLAATVPPRDVAGSIRAVFARRKEWSAERVAERTTMTLALAARMREEWNGWLAPAAQHPGPFLDLGCGAGSFLSVAPVGRTNLGIDVSMEWALVTQRICHAAGVPVHVAAAHAEALPVRAGSIGVVTALDVVEHVGDQAAMVCEIDRVLQRGGIFAGATPNRFSVGAEPHVGIWGVGWLPRPLQARYVRWRTGLPYDSTRLLSIREIQALFRRHASFVPRIEPAPIPLVDQQRFGWRRKQLATAYNRLLDLAPARAAARQLGAFFHVVGTKPPAA